MVNLETGAPHTAHTTNKVPFIMAGPPPKKGADTTTTATYAFTDDKDRKEDEEEGALCDVAPTVLALLGLDKPEGAHVSIFYPPNFPIETGRRNDRPLAARCMSVTHNTIHVRGEKRARRPRGVSLNRIPGYCITATKKSNCCSSQEKRSSYSEPSLKGLLAKESGG